ncbi:hypothetical protein [Bdellovibrio sp. HCB209]|uniref:hypothetical protein n=1 Tax=Bdellovibrio sp. HCB209 TaxID=3394354 RepID=UPI0039B492BB
MPNQQLPTDANFSRLQKDDEEPYQSSDFASPGLIVNPNRKEGKTKIDDWNSRVGELSEVIDSEGHRVRINHY